MNTEKWPEVTKKNPCVICGKPDYCRISPDGAIARCNREKKAGCFKETGGGGFLYRIESRFAPLHARPVEMSKALLHEACRASLASTVDWSAVMKDLKRNLKEPHLEALAKATGVPVVAWKALPVGWADAEMLKQLHVFGKDWDGRSVEGAYAFAEVNGQGRVVGTSFRVPDGRKGFATGAHRGLTVPAGLHKLRGPIRVVEGASDVAACFALGIPAVGRPSNRSGGEDVATMLDGCDLQVIGENDAKDGGAWPGRDGAKSIAGQLAARWGGSVVWTLPPPEAKDIRDWLRQKVAAGLNLDDPVAVQTARGELLQKLKENERIVKAEHRKEADILVDLAKEHFRIGRSNEGEPFAVSLEGPAVAQLIRGGGSSFRLSLAKLFRHRTGKTPGGAGINDAMTALEGEALDATPEYLALRIGPADGKLVVDLGDMTGKAVVVTSEGWQVREESPLLFKRTVLTSAHPIPIEGAPADLLKLRDVLNVDDETWPLTVGYLVAAMMPTIPHPVLMLGGEQGTGKSTAAGILVSLVDPSPVPLRSEPRDPEAWAVTAAGSWIICIDNVSGIRPWFSDALCKAVTGDGMVRRKLYSDSDLAVLAFRRCPVLTSIDPGALRGDLGDRLLLIDLDRIPDDRRRTDEEIHTLFTELRPRLLGALLSAVSKTMAALPNVRLKVMPRMADFARVLAGLDMACPELTGGNAFATFMGQHIRIAEEVVDGDPIGPSILKFLESRDWTGTASALQEHLQPPERVPREWPTKPRDLAGHLRRIAPALGKLGIEVTFGKRKSGGNRERLIQMKRVKTSSQPSQSSLFDKEVAKVAVEGNPSPVKFAATVDEVKPPNMPDEVDTRDDRDDRDGRSGKKPVGDGWEEGEVK